jgi:hypothetical protein
VARLADVPQSLHRVPLGSVAVPYLESSFSDGKTLSHLVLKSIDLTAGAVFTFLPPGSDARALRNFETGGLMKASGSEDAAVATIGEELRVRKSAIFVAEHALARCSDPGIQAKLAKWFCYQDEVYFWIADSGVSDRDVRQVLRNGRSWLNTGFVCSVASVGEVQAGLENPTLQTLKDLAQGVVLILARAYDGEGYIFWQKA